MAGKTLKPAKAERRWPFLLAGVLVVALALAWLLPLCGKVKRGAGSSRAGEAPFRLEPEQAVYAQYGGSAVCKECHEEAYNLWAKSNHGLAERGPETQDAVAFEPARTLHHGTQQTSFRQTSGQYQVVTTGLQGTNEVFSVQRLLGNDPLRQMLLAFPGGRLQVSETAWDPHAREWFDVYGNEDRKPGEWGHWTGRGMNWNSMCAGCHNTRTRKNYDAGTDTYHTAMAERSVTCEACHGPLKAHVDWQRQTRTKAGGTDPGLPKRTPEQVMDTCASCHARRMELTGDFKPGDAFFDHYSPAIVDQSDVFYPDGQVREEDYEYSAFLGSKMHQAGVTCLDCHTRALHAPRLRGNDMCLRCHAGGYLKAPIIQPEAHSHHAVGSQGDECVSCHMPVRVYMQRHPRHDHGLTIPDPLLTKQFGIPNACERCHADKGTEWNLKAVEQWYGTNMNRLYRQRAQTVALARRGEESVVKPLVQMLSTDVNFYWRAVAANLLQRWCEESSVTAALIGQLQDTNALVRQMAAQSLGPLTQAGRADATRALQPLLQDPSRNVRIEAARQLAATLDTNSLAGSEYLHFLNCIADQPLGQMQRGVFELERGNPTNALACFQRASKWDPYSAGIHHELAILLGQMGQPGKAVSELETAVKLSPAEAEYHYKLALAYNEAGASAKALAELETAVRLQPRHARAGYNLGLARNAAGDSTGAIQALLAAETADPSDPRIPYARATIYLHLGQLSEARAAARRALELNPNFAEAITLLQQLP